MKIKRFTFLIITLLFLIVGITLYVNFGVIKSVRFNADMNEKSIEEIHEFQLKLENSIQKLSFSSTSESIGIIKDNAMDNVLIVQSRTLDLKNTLNELNEYGFNRYNIETKELLNKILNLQIYLDNLYFNLNDNSINQIDESVYNYNEVKRIVMDIKSIYENLYKRVLDEINFVFNTLLFGLIIILFALVLIVSRFTYYLIPSLEKKLINTNDNPKIKHKTLFIEEKNIEDSIFKHIEELEFTYGMTQILLNQIELENGIEYLFPFIEDTLEVDRVGIAYIDYRNETIIQVYGKNRNGELKLKVGFELPFVRTSLYDLIDSKKIVINHNLDEQFIQRPKSSSLYYLLQEGIKSNLIYPMINQNKVYGFLFLSSNQKNFFNDIHIKRAEQIHHQLQEILYKDYCKKIS